MPTIVGLTLENQSEFGLKGDGIGPTVVAGFSIKGPDNPLPGYRAVYGNNTQGDFREGYVNIVMVDGTIEVPVSTEAAIYSYDQDVHLQNVYVKAANIIESGVRFAPSEILAGDANSWKQIRRYACRGGNDSAALVIDGVNLGTPGNDYVHYEPLLTVAAPPTNLISQHWDATIPSWEDPDRVSITDFGAIPENNPGSAYDNAPAIQAALNYTTTVGNPHYGKTVFIPRGVFNISSPIMVPDGAKLVGAANVYSQLDVSSSWAPTSATSILTTEDSPTAKVVLAHFLLHGWEPTDADATLGKPPTTAQRFLRYVTVQSGNTLWRDVQINMRQGGANRHETEPYIVIENNGGGRFFNAQQPGGGSDNIWAPNYPTATFCNLRIAGTTLPVSLYNANYGKLNLNGVIRLENCNDVRIYGWKCEQNNDDLQTPPSRALDATDVNHLIFFGNEGIYNHTDAGYVVLNGQCSDVRIANLSRRIKEELPGAYTHLFLTDYGNGFSIPDRPSMALYAKDAPQLRLYEGASVNGTELYCLQEADLGTVLFGGGSSIQTFTINNGGLADLTNLVVTVDGANSGDFVVSALGSTTVTPGGTTTFTVTFTPSATGSRAATAHIASNDSSGDFDLSLVGEGDGGPNQPPVFGSASIYSPNAMEDAAYSGSIAGYASDPDGDALTYSKDSGPAWLSVASDGTLSGTPAIADVGENTFTIQVDATGGSDTATLTITVDFINDAPTFTVDPITLSAATNNVAYIGTVAGSATDPDSGDTLTYSTTNETWFYIHADGRIGGTPTDADVGVNTCTLQVRDRHGETDTAVLNITVTFVNTAPTFTVDPINKVNALKGVPYDHTLVGSAIDLNPSDILTYSKTSGPTWLTVASDGALSGTPGVGDVGTNIWTVQVFDGNGGNDTATLNIVVDSYSDLTISSLPMLESAYVQGGVDNADVPQDWIDGLLLKDATIDDTTRIGMIRVDASSITGSVVSAMLKVYNDDNNAHTLYVYGVNDSASFQDWTGGATGSATWNSVTANGLFPAKQDLYLGDDNLTLLHNQAFFGTDVDTPVWVGGQPLIDFLNTDTDGFVTFVFCIENVVVTSIRPHTHANAPTLNIAFTDGWPPVFGSDPIDAVGAAVNSAYTGTLSGSATDRDVGDTLTYSKVSGPTWLNVAADGTLVGTPLSADVGLNTWTVQVSDDTGYVDTTSLRINVSTLASLPMLDSAYVNALDADTPQSWSDELVLKKNNRIAMIKVDASSISGTLGSATFRVYDTDAKVHSLRVYGVKDSASYQNWTGNNTGDATWNSVGNNGLFTPVADLYALGDANLTLLGGQAFTGAGNDTAATVSGQALTDFLNTDTDGLVTLVFCTDLGELIKIRPHTHTNAPTLQFSYALGPPVFGSDPINKPNAMEDAAYSGSIAGEASDPEGDPMTFAKASGPAWLSVAPDGTLSGTPASGDGGANVFTVQVNSSGGSDTAALNIYVNFINDVPTFTVSPITGTEAMENTAYAGTIAGSATDPDVGDMLTYSKDSGPAWLSVASDGTLSGTPANGDIGTNVFSVKVEDLALASDVATLNILVKEFNYTPTFTENPVNTSNALEGVPYSDTLAGSATDGNAGDTLTYSKTAGPAWLTVASDGTLSGTPGSGDLGTIPFTIMVQDIALAYDTATLNITVVPTKVVNAAPLPMLDSAYVNSLDADRPQSWSDELVLKQNNRIAMIKVDTSGISAPLASATLTVYDTDTKVHSLRVYGVKDSASFQNWTGNNTGDATWNSVGNNGLFTPVADLYAQGDANLTLLGSQALTNSGSDTAVIVSGQALTDFLNTDTDGLVTLVFCTDLGELIKIRPHTHANAPTLEYGYLVPNMTYENWLLDHRPWLGSETNKTDNKDGDSFNNLAEYALGGNPTNSTDTVIVPIAEMVQAGGTNYIEYIHLQRNDTDSLEYRVEVTTNLITGIWTNTLVQIVGTNTASGVEGFDAITNRVPADPKQQFIHLKIK